MLGSHLSHALGAEGALPSWSEQVPRFAWGSREVLRVQLDTAVSRFIAEAASGRHRAWALYWAAGAGVIGTSVEQLQEETRTLEHVLDLLAAQLGRVGTPPGSVFLASSAGGVYGRCPDSPAGEGSRCLPISPYGREKLRQEELLSLWAERHRVSFLIGRISNLYGPGQNLGKPQGLISHLVRNLILNRPVHVYVPMDTLRDYLHVEDCAPAIIRAMSRLRREALAGGGAPGMTKIFASEQASSVASIIGLVSKIARRRPRVIHAAHPLTEQQSRRLTFRSQVWHEDHRPPRTLSVGVSQVHRHMLQLFSSGKVGA
jgi:UDP-glucose 4-epimerase